MAFGSSKGPEGMHKDQFSLIEYDKSNKQQRIESDFDREVKRLLKWKGADE